MEKEVVGLQMKFCLKFTKEARILLLGEFVFAAVEFLKSQRVKFMSSMC